MSLEEEPVQEFRGASLRLAHQEATQPTATVPQVDCHWRNAFMAPLTSIPNKITETIWSSKPKEDPPPTPPPHHQPHPHRSPSHHHHHHHHHAHSHPPLVVASQVGVSGSSATTPPIVSSANQEKSSLQVVARSVRHDPNNFFTFREGVVERAARECVAQFMDAETEGPVLAYFLLTQINHWDTDKERLLMLTTRHLFLIKYDFIALRRLGCRRVAFEDVEGIIAGNLVYPNGSLIPKINGLADGLSSLMETCLFRKWSGRGCAAASDVDCAGAAATRDRNMKGVRLLLRQDKPENFAAKWNPFNDDVPFLTFTYHPLFFHKDCTDEKQRNLYNLELFVEHLCLAVSKCKENSVILQHNVLLENYVGLGSIIHNRHSLGFFKVRGKFSF